MCGDCGDYACCNNECICGESKFVLSAVSSVVGMLFLGILAILYAIFRLDIVWNLTGVVYGPSYDFMILCVSGILALSGIIALKAGDLTEGLLFALVGFFAFIAAADTLFFGYGGVFWIMDWLLFLLLMVIVMLLFSSKDRTFAFAVALFAIGTLVLIAFGGTSGDFAPMVAGIMFLLAGLIFLYVAISDWLFVETGADLPIV